MSSSAAELSSSKVETRAWRALFFIGCVIFAEPLTSTLLFPFVLFMVRDFTDEKDLAWTGTRVGIITSSFFLCQLFTTPIWGAFSDRFGRKPTLIVGLIGGATSMACFGLSRSLEWAVLSRSISGLLNGNLGVARTALAEVAAKYDMKQSKAFSVFGMCGALGYIVGPIIGGMLSNPAETLGIRGPFDVFVAFPYLLPCLVSSLVSIAIMLGVTFGLEETLQPRQAHLNEANPTQTASERSPLLHGALPTGNTPAAHPRAYQTWRFPRGVVILMLATGLIAMHTIMFEEVYPLFAAADLERRAGLSFDSRQIATSLAFVGPAVFAAQLLVYPALNARLDTIRVLELSAVIFAIIYPLVCVVPMISNALARKAFLVALLCMRSSSVIFGWTSLNILTNQIAHPSHRGFITGVVQASASFSRAAGPTLGGTLWSWSENNGLEAPFDFHIFFIAITILALLQLVTATRVPWTVATTD